MLVVKKYIYIGVILKNVYIMYVKVNYRNGVEKIDLISHNNFQKSITLAWKNPTKYRAKFTTLILLEEVNLPPHTVTPMRHDGALT